jgi:16S rRNA (uracil1498-N3)-methyltransferase
MALTRVYTPQTLAPGGRLTLDETASRHLSQVLRLGRDSPLTLFNGDGREAKARLLLISRQGVEVQVLELSPEEPLPRLELTLAQGVSRGERMDFALQKAVELGIGAFVPLFTERSVVRLDPERLERRTAHWRRVAIAACEQSGRRRLVRIEPAQHLRDWLASRPVPGIYLHPQAEHPIAKLEAPPGRLSLLAGPEGGLSEDEIHLARDTGLVGARLGPRILRTETAPLAALAAIQALWGDFR